LSHSLELGQSELLRAECWVGLSDSIGLLLDQPGGSLVGFKLKAASKFDEQAETAYAVWHGPHFHAPQVGLEDAPIGGTGEARAAYEKACEIEVADGEEGEETDAAELLVVRLDGDSVRLRFGWATLAVVVTTARLVRGVTRQVEVTPARHGVALARIISKPVEAVQASSGHGPRATVNSSTCLAGGAQTNLRRPSWSCRGCRRGNEYAGPDTHLPPA